MYCLNCQKEYPNTEICPVCGDQLEYTSTEVNLMSKPKKTHAHLYIREDVYMAYKSRVPNVSQSIELFMINMLKDKEKEELRSEINGINTKISALEEKKRQAEFLLFGDINNIVSPTRTIDIQHVPKMNEINKNEEPADLISEKFNEVWNNSLNMTREGLMKVKVEEYAQTLGLDKDKFFDFLEMVAEEQIPLYTLRDFTKVKNNEEYKEYF